jgi:hypothetical protein
MVSKSASNRLSWYALLAESDMASRKAWLGKWPGPYLEFHLVAVDFRVAVSGPEDTRELFDNFPHHELDEVKHEAWIWSRNWLLAAPRRGVTDTMSTLRMAQIS